LFGSSESCTTYAHLFFLKDFEIFDLPDYEIRGKQLRIGGKHLIDNREFIETTLAIGGRRLKNSSYEYRIMTTVSLRIEFIYKNNICYSAGEYPTGSISVDNPEEL
jgi:hypothetical protein